MEACSGMSGRAITNAVLPGAIIAEAGPTTGLAQ
jgi:hypothetical protein